jgi:hypothetical protein
MNLSLFSLNPAESGYRLHRMEIWNWGTFDNKIYTIEPGGENSLHFYIELESIPTVRETSISY